MIYARIRLEIRNWDWDFVMNQSKIQNLRLVFFLIG